MAISNKLSKYHYPFLLTLLYVGILCMPDSLLAQKQIAFEHLSVRDGLSDVSAYTFQKGKLGYLWIGTQEGLNRYDGNKVVSYLHNPLDSNSLAENNIKTLLKDSQGRLWVGTNGGGLCQYIYEKDAFETYSPEKGVKGKLQHGDIWGLAEDQKGNIWIGTGKGLHVLPSNSSSFDLYLPLSDISTLAYEKANDKLWIGDYDKGLYYIDFAKDMTPQPVIVRDTWIRRALRRVTHLYVDEEALWIGTREYGLIYYHLATETWTPLHRGNSKLPLNRIQGIAKDDNGLVWIGTDNGLVELQTTNDKPEILAIYKNDSDDISSIAENMIRNVYNDGSGHLWIGTRTEGADRLYLRQKPFRNLTREEKQVPHNTIRALLGDGKNKLWIGSDGGGLALYDRSTNTSTSFVANGTLTNKSICAIYKDSRKRIWVGTRDGLALKASEEDDDFISFDYNEKDSTTIPGPEIFSIAEDSRRRIWIASSQGLATFNEATQGFQRIRNTNSSLPFEDINCLTFNEKTETLWIGTYGRGIIKSTPEKMEFVSFPVGIKENGKLANALINCLHIGSDGFVWAGTFKDGIFRINPDTGEYFHYNMGNGLTSNIIFAIEEDDAKHLWVSTAKGLMKYELEREKWRNYDNLDGLPSTEFNYGKSAQTSDGQLFFGGTQGVIYFQPDSIVDNTSPPKVVLTQLTVLNKVIKPGKNSPLSSAIAVAQNINLSYDQAFFSISYTSLSYAHKESNSYAYRLEGLEKEWNEVDNRDEAFYTNVPPGTYTFHVKASNSDGVWNEEGASIQITITPPFWKQPIFIGVSIAIGALLIWVVYKQRIKNIELSKRLLEEEVAKRTLEVVNQKEELAQQAKNLQNANELVKGQHEQLLERQAETERAYARVNTISNIGKELSGHLEIESLVSSMYEQMAEIMKVDSLGVGVYNPLLNRIDFKGFKEANQTLPLHYDDIDDSTRLSIHTFRGTQTIWVNDVVNDVPPITGKEVTVSSGQMTNAAIYLPLISEGETLGVLTVQSFEKNAYTQGDVDLLKAVGVYVSVAVANILSFETIQEKNNQITDSIRYAQTIQQALLPFPEQLNEAFNQHFVCYKPKDIVSGDFYWLSHVPQSEDWLIAVVDCTGHGVPGGFMSMIGSRLLSEAVQDRFLTKPSEILEYIDSAIRRVLQQESSKGNKDGMEIALCYCKRTSNQGLDIIYSGAKMGLFYCLPEAEEVVEVSGTRREIGGVTFKRHKPFIDNTFHLPPNSLLYISSDGLPDQNTEHSRRMGKQRLKELILQQAHLPIQEQGDRIKQLLSQMLKGTHQRDDITVIGIRV